MKNYILKVQLNKNRDLKGRCTKDAVEKYLSLALGCDVKLLYSKEIISYEKAKSNNSK